MNEQDLRGLIEDVRRGKLSRRAFTRAMVALGLTAPLATQMLAYSGVAVAAEKPVYKPTKRGGGGALKVLWWQAPTLLNPHFATGTKDQDASRIFYEPLAAWDADGNLVPVLAAEIPSRRERRPVRGRHVRHLEAQAGREVARRPAVHRRRLRLQLGICRRSGDRRGDHRQLQGRQGRQGRRPHHPRGVSQADAVLGRCLRRPVRHDDPRSTCSSRTRAPSRARRRPTWRRSAPAPTLFVDFKPGDLVQGKINPNYHMENRPYFDTIEMKGGGDAVSAARAVLQTGEYDFAWNMQVEDEILKRLEASGKGTVVITPPAASSTSSSTTPIPGMKWTASGPASSRSIRT